MLAGVTGRGQRIYTRIRGKGLIIAIVRINKYVRLCTSLNKLTKFVSNGNIHIKGNPRCLERENLELNREKPELNRENRENCVQHWGTKPEN